MRKKLIVNFDKKYKEDLLVDLVCSILRDLYRQKKFFFLDNVLIDADRYHFIFSGNIKAKKILIEKIKKYIAIQKYRCVF